MSADNEKHIPTDENRAIIRRFTIGGLTHEDIALYFDIDVNTLRKYYREDLHNAKMDKLAILGENLYIDALNGCKQSRELYLRCQGKWSNYKPLDSDPDKQAMSSLLEKLIEKI